jgi:ferredoxin-type protein NapG
MAKDDRPLDRRQFFRRGFSELLKPLAKSLEPVERTIGEFERLSKQASASSALSASSAKAQAAAGGEPANKIPLQLWLRPPGALPEQKFLETCSRGGECVTACPADAIKLDRTGAAGKGGPYIDPNEMACVACDGLACMSACPSRALVPTPLTQIKMGTAVWREHLCVRSRGETCTKCVDVCPLGTAAIDCVNNEIVVKPLACIGCGLCQQHCPTQPKSITVIPVAARQT